jgi:hypothetical protein
MNHQREAVARAKGGVASAASAHAAAAAELEETESRHSTASADYALEVDRLAQLSGAYVDQHSPISPPYDPQAHYGEPDDEPLHEEQRSWRGGDGGGLLYVFLCTHLSYPPSPTLHTHLHIPQGERGRAGSEQNISPIAPSTLRSQAGATP